MPLCLCGFVYYVLCICVFFECVCAFSSFRPPFFFALNLINFHVKTEKRKFNQRTHCQRNGIDTQVRASKNNYTTTATTTWWNCSNMHIHPSFMVMVFHLNSAFKWTLLSMNTLICAYRIVVTMDVFWLITQKCYAHYHSGTLAACSSICLLKTCQRNTFWIWAWHTVHISFALLSSLSTSVCSRITADNREIYFSKIH